jgi:hypothetical protein
MSHPPHSSIGSELSSRIHASGRPRLPASWVYPLGMTSPAHDCRRASRSCSMLTSTYWRLNAVAGLRLVTLAFEGGEWSQCIRLSIQHVSDPFSFLFFMFFMTSKSLPPRHRQRRDFASHVTGSPECVREDKTWVGYARSGARTYCSSLHGEPQPFRVQTSWRFYRIMPAQDLVE